MLTHEANKQSLFSAYVRDKAEYERIKARSGEKVAKESIWYELLQCFGRVIKAMGAEEEFKEFLRKGDFVDTSH